MRRVEITDELLSEDSLWKWLTLRRRIETPLGRFELFIVLLALLLYFCYFYKVVASPFVVPLNELKGSAKSLIEIVVSISGTSISVLIPSFAIFMALGQTRNLSNLANFEDEKTSLNQLKVAIFPFLFASVISVFALFFSYVLKLFLQSVWIFIFNDFYWSTSILLCVMYLSILILLALGVVLKDFIYNMAHIVIFIIINAQNTDELKR